MHKRHVFIINPAAGRKKHLSLISDIEAFCNEYSIPYDVILTKKPGDATAIASREANGNVLIAVGGDGTVHEVANGMIGTDSVLGIIPNGTGNDFALQCGYSSNSKENLQTLRQSETRHIDVGLLNNKTYIINAISFGFDALVSKRAKILAPYVGGFFSYLFTAIASLPLYGYSNMHVEADNTVIDGELLFFVCANGKRYGAGFMIAPSASMRDGFLDMVVVRKAHWFYLLRNLPKLISGTHTSLPEVSIQRTTYMNLTTSRLIEAQIDGELVPLGQNYDVKIVKKALQVIINREKTRV